MLKIKVIYFEKEHSLCHWHSLLCHHPETIAFANTANAASVSIQDIKPVVSTSVRAALQTAGPQVSRCFQ